MTIGLVVLAAAVLVTVAVALLRRSRDGRLRAAPAATSTASASPAAAVVDGLGERATLVQFSTAFCAPCRGARQLLGLVAEQSPGVRHVEIDAESHLELVRQLRVLRTPTTLVLDAAGRETARVTGLPRRDEIEAVLAPDRTPAS